MSLNIVKPFVFASIPLTINVSTMFNGFISRISSATFITFFTFWNPFFSTSIESFAPLEGAVKVYSNSPLELVFPVTTSVSFNINLINAFGIAELSSGFVTLNTN